MIKISLLSKHPNYYNGNRMTIKNFCDGFKNDAFDSKQIEFFKNDLQSQLSDDTHSLHRPSKMRKNIDNEERARVQHANKMTVMSLNDGLKDIYVDLSIIEEISDKKSS